MIIREQDFVQGIGCATAAQEKLKGTSKNSEFAQMQGVEKISPRRI
jgi:hypothetical protein